MYADDAGKILSHTSVHSLIKNTNGSKTIIKKPNFIIFAKMGKKYNKNKAKY